MQHTLPVVASFIISLLVYLFIARRLSPPLSRWQPLRYLLLGMLTIIPVGVLVYYLERWGKGHNFFHNNFLAYSFFEVLMLAAVPEEISRYLILRWRLPRQSSYSLDQCMMLGCMVGLGFGGAEYLLFTSTAGWEATWQRAITSLPYHTAAGGIIGYYVGAYIHHKYVWSFWGLFITIPLHAFNNFNLRNFESITMTETSEPEHTVLQQILFSHWPSNLFVTITASVLAVALYRLAKRSIRS